MCFSEDVFRHALHSPREKGKYLLQSHSLSRSTFHYPLFLLFDCLREHGTMRKIRNIHLFMVLGIWLLIGVVYLTYTYSLFNLFSPQYGILNGRKDVVTVTPWLAPVVWEGTFNTDMIDAIYKPRNITVVTTVFAVGKYVQFLKDFLESAEKYYLLGYRVHYYVFTNQPDAVPMVTLGANRTLTTIEVPSSNRWQEITLRRMEKIEQLIENQLSSEVDYIFSLDVDTKFYGHWGAETLDRRVAALHFGFYRESRDTFTYERRPESQAYIPYGKGDFYYAGAMIGGEVEEVHKLAKTCRTQLDVDKANSIEAVWQEESHLNKYFLYNKPTKVLSPEYMWNGMYTFRREIQIIRYSHVTKDYSKVRPN